MWLRRLLLLSAMSLAACIDDEPEPPPAATPAIPRPPPAPPPSDAEMLRPVFIDACFDVVHQTFMQYGLTKTERSEVWARFYKNRWVHWTGQLVKVSAAAMLFRQLGATSSYDVLVRVPHIAPSTRTSLLPGRVYNYVGRLDSYDDLFRTIYLEQGQVFDAGPEGVPGVLQTALPLARRFPPPPRIYAGPPGVALPGVASAQAVVDPLRPASLPPPPPPVR